MKKKAIILVPLAMLIIGFVLSAVLMSSCGEDGTALNESVKIENAPFFDIFFNNLVMSLLFILGGGVLSSIMALAQGISFGVLFGIWLTVGNSAGDFALLFLPHVVFEAAAILVASMIGFSLLRYLLSKEKESFLHFSRSQLPQLCAVFLCVLSGAAVESFVTPVIYSIV